MTSTLKTQANKPSYPKGQYEFDIIIVGAGAAGLTLASSLNNSLNILLLEKKTKPYVRIACAEWTPPHFNASAINKTDAMVTTYEGNTLTSAFKGKIIDRQTWQEEMLQKLPANVDIHLGEPMVNLENDILRTNKGKYRAKLIVGADGPRSRLRTLCKLPISPLLPAINARAEVFEKLSKTFIYFMPEIEKGYGWLFPKGTEANIGVGASRNLGASFNFFVDFLRKKGMIKGQITTKAAGFIPLYGLTPTAGERIVFIGDAAGLTDPLTGAGIHQAWDSAKELAHFINKDFNIVGYARYIKKMYASFLKRRHSKRQFFENNWSNLKQAVEGSWISFSRA